MSDTPKFIVVIGGSAGGLNVLLELVHHLEKNCDAAYCIVLHLSRTGTGDFVVHRIKQVITKHCSIASDGAPIENDTIYVGCPNQHMLVKDGKFKLGAGPEENRWRPSIDVLFRSAADACSSHAIGIVLSGILDDGTSGMWAIKRSGGICIVHDPNQAEFPDMPISVINHIDVDFVVGLSEMNAIIGQAIAQAPSEKGHVPEDVLTESLIAEKTAVGIEDVEKLTIDRSVYACPDCG